MRRRPNRRLRDDRAAATSWGTVESALSASGAAGMDASHQRVDEPIGDLRAESAGDEVSDREVTGDQRARQDEIPRRPDQSEGREQARSGEWRQVLGYAQYQPVGQGPQAALPPEQGASLLRGDQIVDPQLLTQLESVGHPGYERVRSGIDEAPFEDPRLYAAAEGSRLEDGHLRIRAQLPGGGQPGDTATDDGNPQVLISPR